MFVNSAEPNDSPLSTLPGCSLTPPVSDKVGSAERQGLPQATGGEAASALKVLFLIGIIGCIAGLKLS
ncbi:hypothetical protein AB0B51_00280, partial [Streptomyces griseus]